MGCALQLSEQQRTGSDTCPSFLDLESDLILISEVIILLSLGIFLIDVNLHKITFYESESFRI
jgi:hypothetical protein